MDKIFAKSIQGNLSDDDEGEEDDESDESDDESSPSSPSSPHLYSPQASKPPPTLASTSLLTLTLTPTHPIPLALLDPSNPSMPKILVSPDTTPLSAIAPRTAVIDELFSLFTLLQSALLIQTRFRIHLASRHLQLLKHTHVQRSAATTIQAQLRRLSSVPVVALQRSAVLKSRARTDSLVNASTSSLRQELSQTQVALTQAQLELADSTDAATSSLQQQLSEALLSLTQSSDLAEERIQSLKLKWEEDLRNAQNQADDAQQTIQNQVRRERATKRI